MAAYSAVVSLMNTIHRLIFSTPKCISFVSPSEDILYSAYHNLKSLQDVLDKIEQGRMRWRVQSERVEAFEGDERCSMESRRRSALESLLSTQTQSESHDPLLLFSVDLRELSPDIYCFTETVNRAEEYLEELESNIQSFDDEEEGEEEAAVSSTTYLGRNMSEMVGFTDMFGDVRDTLIRDRVNVSIIGMAGIGKTTLAKRILEDPLVMEKFGRRIFVPVGPPSDSTYYKLYKILIAIVAEVNRIVDENLVYLIVLDDLWDLNLLRDLCVALRYSYNGCRVLVTTRQQGVGRYIGKGGGRYDMRFMNKDESWDLLRGKVFADKVCPPQLEIAGKKIAKNCEGLTLLIVTVANLLSKAEKTPEHWDKVAADKQNSIFEKAYDQIFEVLYPSYYWLNENSKACFLYLAVFPQNYEVRCSRLFNLWSGEYFIFPTKPPKDHLDDLDSENVVMLHTKGIKDKEEGLSLHSVKWHLCKKEARKIMFLHTLNKLAHGFVENIERQRRLSIYKNALFGVKDVYNSVASVSNARSLLLCTGAYHQYQLPICFGSLRLLKVLDALTIPRRSIGTHSFGVSFPLFR